MVTRLSLSVEYFGKCDNLAIKNLGGCDLNLSVKVLSTWRDENTEDFIHRKFETKCA